MSKILAVIVVALLLGACSSEPGKSKDETRGWAVEKLYGEAKAELDAGNYKRAVGLFEKLGSRYPYGRYAQQAQLELAYAYFKDNERASAIATCDRFIQLYPTHENVDYAYYLKGLISFNEDLGLVAKLSDQDPTERDPQAMRESFDALQELVERFPESRYAPDALKRMRYLVNALASSEVRIAEYYLRRRAYVAAVNRAQTAVKTYTDAPANEEALFIMIKAYDKLGMNDLRDDTERVMRRNFPKSEYYARGLNRAEPWWKLW